jgi:hypothetical protein
MLSRFVALPAATPGVAPGLPAGPAPGPAGGETAGREAAGPEVVVLEAPAAEAACLEAEDVFDAAMAHRNTPLDGDQPVVTEQADTAV